MQDALQTIFFPQVSREHSIESHFSFMFQVLGFEIDSVNSVQFSNHTGMNIYLFYTEISALITKPG